MIEILKNFKNQLVFYTRYLIWKYTPRNDVNTFIRDQHHKILIEKSVKLISQQQEHIRQQPDSHKYFTSPNWFIGYIRNDWNTIIDEKIAILEKEEKQ